jgi:ribose transport system permease protein
MKENMHKSIQRYGMPIALLLLVVLLQVFNINVPLFSYLNIKNILLQTVSIALAALGVSYIMISGEGDMSFAGVFSLLTVVFAIIVNNVNSFIFGFIVVIIIALSINSFISLLVTKLNFSSFIVSIAVMFMAIGIEKALHQQTTIINSKEIKAFSTVEFGLPIVVWLMILLFIASFLVVNKTKFGFELRIVGENKLAGIEAGINIQVMKIIAYIIAGSLLGLAATIESTRVGAIYLQGQNYMLPIFAACYLGSSMFIPGRVNILGTFVGALFMGIIGSFMKMMNVESYIIPIVQGTILIIAVGVASFRTRDKIQQVKV